MKKRIIIAVIIVALLAAIGFSLYFFVFRNKNIGQEQAARLIDRMAIDMGVLEDYKNSPELKDFNTGTDEYNIINSTKIPFIGDIPLTIKTWEINEVNNEIDSTKDFINYIKRFMDIENFQQNRVYQENKNISLVEKTVFKTVKNEIIFVTNLYQDEILMLTVFNSIFYDSVNEEYKTVSVAFSDKSKTISVHQIIANFEGLVRTESYSLSGFDEKDLAKSINNGDGTSYIKITDFENKKLRTNTISKSSSMDDHFVLSSYIHRIYENFNEQLADTVKLIEDEKKPIEIDNNMKQERAAALIDRLAIDMGALKEYEGSLKLDFLYTSTDEYNIINSTKLPFISNIPLTSKSWEIDEVNNEINSTKDFINYIKGFMDIENFKQNKVYQENKNISLIEKMVFKTVKNEIILINNLYQDETLTLTVFNSIFYDSVNKEYKIASIAFSTEFKTLSVHKIIANSKGLVRVEDYSLSGFDERDLEKSINDGDGTSYIKIMDFKNKTIKTNTIDKDTSVNNHFALSSYIHRVYENFNEKLADTLKLIEDEKKPINLSADEEE